MPRIRTLKPEHRQHRKVGRLSDRDYRLWVGMICEADDEGRLVADPAQLRLVVFGYQKITTGQVAEALDRIAALGLIQIYDSGAGEVYAAFPSWHEHQRINRRQESQLPAPDEPSVNGHVIMSERSVKVHGSFTGDRKGSEGSERKEATSSTSSVNVHFNIPESVVNALDRAPALGQPPRLRDPAWWQAEVRANPGVDFAAEVLKAEAWLRTNQQRKPRKDLARFLHNWFTRADRAE